LCLRLPRSTLFPYTTLFRSQLVRARFQHVLAAHQCRTTDHFAGFQITGRFRTAELVELIKALPEGTTEFMCHPGRCTDELRAARDRKSTRLNSSHQIISYAV